MAHESFSEADVRRHLLAGIVLCLAFFAPRLASDGALYHEVLRSLAIDGDLNLANERELHTWRYVPVFPSYGVGHGFRDTGYPRTPFNIGSPLLELPGFTLGHLASLLASAAGYDVIADGYSFPERLGAAMTSFPLAALGLFLTWRFVALLSTRPQESREEGKLLLTSAAVVFLASPLPAFILVTPTFSHAAAFALGAAFLAFTADWVGGARTGRQDVVLGLLLGGATLVRTQCLFLGVILLVEPFMTKTSLAPRSLWSLSRSYLRIAAAAFVAYSPQLAFNTVVFGTPFIDPQGTGGMRWLHPRFDLFLFDGTRGLLVTSPLLFVAVAGLLPLWKRRRVLFAGLLLAVIVQFYLDSVRRDWAGVGFGVRRIILLLPIFAAGHFELLTALRRRPRLFAAAMALSGMAVLWNFALMGQYYLTDLSAPMSAGGAMRIMEVNLREGARLVLLLMTKGLLGSVVAAPSQRAFAKALLFLAAVVAAGACLAAAKRLLPVFASLLPVVILAAVAGFLTMDAYLLKMLFAPRNLQVVSIEPPSKETARLPTTHLVLGRNVPYEGVRNGFVLDRRRSGYQVRKPYYLPGFLTPPVLRESFHEAPAPFLFDAHGQATSAIELVLGWKGELEPGRDFLELRLDPGLRVVLRRERRAIRARPEGIEVRRISLLQRRDLGSERVVSLALEFDEPRLILRAAIDRVEGAPSIVLRGFALRTP